MNNNGVNRSLQVEEVEEVETCRTFCSRDHRGGSRAEETFEYQRLLVARVQLLYSR